MFSNALKNWLNEPPSYRFSQPTRRYEELRYDKPGKTAVIGGVRFTFRPASNVGDDAAQAVYEALLLEADGKQIPESLRARMVKGGMDPKKVALFKTPVTGPVPPWLSANMRGYDYVNPGDITVYRQRGDGTWEAVETWNTMEAADRRKALQGDAFVPMRSTSIQRNVSSKRGNDSSHHLWDTHWE